MYERTAQLDLFAQADTTPAAVANCDECGSWLDADANHCPTCYRRDAELLGLADAAPAAKPARTAAEAGAPWFPTHPRVFRSWLWEHLAKHQRFPRSYRPLAVEAVAQVAAGGEVPAWIARTPEHVRIVKSAANWYGRKVAR